MSQIGSAAETVGPALAGPLLFALALGIGFTRLMLGLSTRVGFVDRPGAHKAHGREVPLGGGVAITSAVVVPIALGSLLVWLHHKGTITLPAPESFRAHLSGMAERVPSLLKIVGCALFLMVVGVIDDHRPLPPLPKFAAQFAAAIVTAWPLGVRMAEALPAPLSIALTVLWIVVITNAFNFLDNMDGLSAGVGAIASIVFAVAALRAGQVFVPMIALTLGGALLGFLVFNFAPARIFMGDAGSLVIGYLMSVVTILTTYYEPGRAMTPLALIVPLLVLAVPLYDVCSVVVIRLRAGDSPFRGDRRHFSHRLKRRGLSTRGAVLTIYLATAATGLPAIALPRADWFASALILLQCVCVVTIIAILEGQDAAGDPPEPRA